MRPGFLGGGKEKSPDPYDSFATVYDRWQALYPQPFSLAMTIRMQQAWDEFGVPEHSLLDFACGTGTLAWWWSERHPDWNIVGIDRSAPMIERAQQGGPDRKTSGGAPRPQPEPSHPSFRTQDMSRVSLRDLDCDTGFGMVTCFFDSLNHVTKAKDLEGVLRSARRCLLPDGLFVFDLIDEDGFPEIFGSPWIVQNDRLYVGCESEYFERRGAEYGRVQFTFFEKRRNEQSGGDAHPADNSSDAIDGSSSAETGVWKRSETEILERAWPREVFDPMVDEAGLEIIHVQLIDPDEQPDVFVSRRLYVCRPKP